MSGFLVQDLNTAKTQYIPTAFFLLLMEKRHGTFCVYDKYLINMYLLSFKIYLAVQKLVLNQFIPLMHVKHFLR